VLQKDNVEAKIRMVKRGSISNSQPLCAREKPSETTHTQRKNPIFEGHFVLIRDGEPFLQWTISLSRKNTLEP